MNSEAWDQRYRDGSADWPEGPAPGVDALTRSLPPGDALEMACGTGRNAIYLARGGWSVTAVDFAAAALDIARRRASTEKPKTGIEWLHRDLTRWKPSESSFDLVVITYLHIPWDSFLPVLGSAEAAVRPGGTLFVLGHDRSNVTEGTGKPKHIDVTYTAGELAAALERCSVMQAEVVKRSPDHGATANPEVLQIDCVVRAQRNLP